MWPLVGNEFDMPVLRYVYFSFLTYCFFFFFLFQTCHPKTAGSLCRAAEYECDLPEYCTGQSEYCPSDIYKMDTEACDGGKVCTCYP